MAPLYFGDAKVDIFLKQQRKIAEFEKNLPSIYFALNLMLIEQIYCFCLLNMHKIISFLTFAG
jgi:hypothetical protein